MEPETAERVEPTRVDGDRVLGALSPSRAADFLGCPLLFRFRTIDKLPEPTSAAALRGTLIHQVLEDLFDLEPSARIAERAAELVDPTWEAVLAQEPDSAELFADTEALSEWLASCREVLATYFALEDPRRLQPESRELYVETITDDKLLLRGVIDRVDVASDGALRIVDYKSSRAPRPGYEASALFQLRFYALVLWRSRGVIPRELRLIYLGSNEIVTYEPDADDLLATERKVLAIWRAIKTARETGEFLPSKGFQCQWCAHQALCPEYGGTPPPMPSDSPPIDAAEALTAAAGRS